MQISSQEIVPALLRIDKNGNGRRRGARAGLVLAGHFVQSGVAMGRICCCCLIVVAALAGRPATAAAPVVDAERGWLFVPRGADGLTVFDTRGGKVLAQLAGTRDVVGVALAPRYDRAYVANRDGTLTTLALSTLTLIRWQHLDAAGLAGLYYEAGQRRLHALAGAGGGATAIITLDAANGTVLGRTELGAAAGAPPPEDDD
jgi:hypothetical protein